MKRIVLIILFLAFCQCTPKMGFLGWKDLHQSAHAAYPELDLYAHQDIKYMIIGVDPETGMMFYITPHAIIVMNKIPER